MVLRTTLSAAITLLVVHAAPPSAAAPSLSGTADYRYLVGAHSDVLLDGDGTHADSGVLGEHRLRAAVTLDVTEAWRVVAEADLLVGVLHGDKTSPRVAALEPELLDAPGNFRPRQAYIQYVGIPGLLRVGQMTSQWGLGLVANDGAADSDPFGFSRRGDRVFRALWGLRPLAYFGGSDDLLVAVGADAVEHDENADFFDGDRAYQAILSVLWQKHRRAFGTYLVRREQTDDDGDELSATVADVFFRYRRTFRLQDGPASALELSGEGVVVSGNTTRVATHNAREGVDVLSVGWALRSDLEIGSSRFRLEAGFASGDENAEDNQNRTYSFDPDYRVGLVLFEEVLSRRSRRTVERIGDPDRTAVAPKGVDGLETEGRVSGVTYLYPSVVVRPRPWLAVRGAAVIAWSSADPVDPFTTFERGGAPTTSLEEPASSRYLGTEVDAGLDVTFPVGDSTHLFAGVVGGVFFPGSRADIMVSRVVGFAGSRF